jgi:hypothetical protein
MQRFRTLQTLRMLLALCAAGAITACAGGSQQVTPTGGMALNPASVANHVLTTSSASEDTGDGDDGVGAIVYSSIPKPLKAVASIGFEAYQGLEFGDGVNLTHTGKLQRVRYVLTSWGCQSGHWFSSDCITVGKPKFPVPFTVNVYAYSSTNTSHVGALLTTQTKSFNIPFRPSSDHVKCPDGQTFYSPVDAACIHGLANVIVFNFSAPRVSLPAQTIVTLVYNTTHYGPHPIGEAAPCFTSSGGCGYDSLNISAEGPGGPVGSPIDPNGIFDNFAIVTAQNYCPGATTTGFRLDTSPGCWTVNHPQLEVRVASGEGRDSE